MPELLHSPVATAEWTVLCLCADWCGTCRDYRPLLAARAARDAATRHLWLDVEDEAALLGELDIETFPTLLIAHRGEPRFYGPVLPQIAALDQLLQRLAGGMASTLAAEAGTVDLAALAAAGLVAA